ncbi:hypothetical protein DW986_03270 [Parabacteroides merdae]|uniref:Uncharacterized protein n=1 Tax=Parabacteroides merdae TaxID=46503 RepID=A0A3R6E3Z1_9BACT|nr:hypothetical protein DW986_03270 [Parabacteroides merdae]
MSPQAPIKCYIAVNRIGATFAQMFVGVSPKTAIAFPANTANSKFNLYLLAHRLVFCPTDIHVSFLLFALSANTFFI